MIVETYTSFLTSRPFDSHFPIFPFNIGDISFKDLIYLLIFPLVQVITTEYKNSDHTGFKLLMHVRMKLISLARFFVVSV